MHLGTDEAKSELLCIMSEMLADGDEDHLWQIILQLALNGETLHMYCIGNHFCGVMHLADRCTCIGVVLVSRRPQQCLMAIAYVPLVS